MQSKDRHTNAPPRLGAVHHAGDEVVPISCHAASTAILPVHVVEKKLAAGFPATGLPAPHLASPTLLSRMNAYPCRRASCVTGRSRGRENARNRSHERMTHVFTVSIFRDIRSARNDLRVEYGAGFPKMIRKRHLNRPPLRCGSGTSHGSKKRFRRRNHAGRAILIWA